MSWEHHQLTSVLNLVFCLAIVWACICRLNTETCRRYRRPRARYTLLMAGAFASGMQPALFQTLPGPGETIFAATVLAGMVINVGRWVRQYGKRNQPEQDQ